MTTGFIDQRMSVGVASGFIGGPEWSTNVQTLSSGREKRNKLWQFPKHHYTANVGAFTASDVQELRSIFYACAGQWGAFRFQDLVDFTATDEPLSVAVGTMTPVQLIKTYAFGAQEAVRQIQAPVSGSVVVLDSDGVTTIPGACDFTTGLFIPSSNWPHSTASWSGQFDVWVRFMSDYGSFTAIRPELLTADIELLEVSV
jgi:uncharacterized protein (TIGR02217 family)